MPSYFLCGGHARCFGVCVCAQFLLIIIAKPTQPASPKKQKQLLSGTCSESCTHNGTHHPSSRLHPTTKKWHGLFLLLQQQYSILLQQQHTAATTIYHTTAATGCILCCKQEHHAIIERFACRSKRARHLSTLSSPRPYHSASFLLKP